MLTDADRENVMKLVLASKTENLITSTHFMDVSRNVKYILSSFILLFFYSHWYIRDFGDTF